ARLEFENGTVAELTVNRVATEKFRRTRVFQCDNHITIDFLRKTAAICRFQNGEQVEEQISCEDSNAIMEELKSFGASIREDKEPPVPLRDGLNSMEIAFRIMEEMNR